MAYDNVFIISTRHNGKRLDKHVTINIIYSQTNESWWYFDCVHYSFLIYCSYTLDLYSQSIIMSANTLHNHRKFAKYCKSIGLLLMNNSWSALKSFFIGLKYFGFYAHIFSMRNNSIILMLQSISYYKCWLQKLEKTIYGLQFIHFLSI